MRTLLAGLILLGGCTATQLQTAQTDISAGITAACNDVMAATKTNPSSSVVPWATGACATATQVAALVQNSSTIQWLGQVQAQLSAPTSITVKPTS